jgi:transposase
MIGRDLAKHRFQIHGAAAGKIAVKRRLRRTGALAFFWRQEPCLAGKEAGAAAHHFACEPVALGHGAKLMPAAYVKAYVKASKTACVACLSRTSTGNRRRCRTGRAICRSAGAPCWSMRRAPIWPNPASSRPKAAAASMSWPRSKRTVLALPDLARAILRPGAERLNDTQAKVRQIETTLAQWHRNDRASKLLATVPGGGVMGASAIRATVRDPSLFRPGREFAAWPGGKSRKIQRAS